MNSPLHLTSRPRPGQPATPAVGAIAPEALETLLLGSHELALLDVREARGFHSGHLNLARCAPLSGLELEVDDFVPRRATAIVVYDDRGDPDGAAAHAARLLIRLGYADVRTLQGGFEAWRERGLPWIDGWNTLIKAFGDQVRQHYGTPVLPLSDLQAFRSGDAPVTLIDVRPADEFAYLSITGARNHPGTELALREWPAEGDDALWAINCFSRTRGILGATTLKLLGHRGATFLEDGVMAWSLRGGKVQREARPEAGLPVASQDVLVQRAASLRVRAGLQVIDAARLAQWRADPERTLYIFDVRAESASSAADVRHVPGGQVLMHFEQLVGTRNARVVLVDDPHGLRAAVTGFWLKQFNQCEVAVLAGEAPPCAIDTSRERDEITDTSVDPAALSALLASGETTIVDVGPSEDFERQHLPGARYLLPASLAPLAPLIARGCPIVFTSPDGKAARIVARNARREWPDAGPLSWLAGGTRAWAGSMRPVRSHYSPEDLLTPFDDDWGSTMRIDPSQRDSAWRRYLLWERTLSARLTLDRTVRFRLLDA